MKGLDCGTGNYVAATSNKIKLQRNAFLTIPQNPTTKKSLKRLNIPFVELNNRLHVVGKHAYEYAQIFGNNELKRPMSKGLLNPKEQDALPILKLIISDLLGKPTKENELVVYCIPSNPIDEENLVDYHEDVLKQLIEQTGYTARSINEGEALAFAGLVDDNLTGIAISMGAGMCLRGDTKIPLLNGKIKTIKELTENYADEKFWVYSSKKDGQVVPGLAWNPHKVKTADRILRLWFDNDAYLDCTPDHLIMMRDGSFKEAQELNTGDSLMPLYRQEHDKKVWNNEIILAEYNTNEKLSKFYNHKVVKIEHLNIKEDVYDMTVDKYHNFAIDSGIFVHNCNISIMYAGMSALTFSVARGGDFIDQNVARDCGITAAKAQYIKEHMSSSIDANTKIQIEGGRAKLKEPQQLTREEHAVKTYYGVLVRYLLANISKQFASGDDMPNFPSPVPIVVGGGTSMIPGFVEIFSEQFNQKEFPINISEIRQVDEPLTAVARGCFADAMLEEEA